MNLEPVRTEMIQLS